MAYTLIWSHAALDDIDGVAEYISKDSLYHAQRVVERLLELGDSLPENPKIGRAVPELDHSRVRERFVYSYRLIYELHDDVIHILAVIHGKRLLEAVGRFTP